jgi:hypothetical protein
MLKRKDKHYISDLDRFLFEFAEQHTEASDSQRKECYKYEKINQLRDHPQADAEKNQLWEGF